MNSCLFFSGVCEWWQWTFQQCGKVLYLKWFCCCVILTKYYRHLKFRIEIFQWNSWFYVFLNENREIFLVNYRKYRFSGFSSEISNFLCFEQQKFRFSMKTKLFSEVFNKNIIFQARFQHFVFCYHFPVVNTQFFFFWCWVYQSMLSVIQNGHGHRMDEIKWMIVTTEMVARDTSD